MPLIETLRRLIFVTGILAAAVMVLWPAPELYRVSAVDFAQLQKQRIGRFAGDLKTLSKEAGLSETPDIDSPAAGPVDQFAARETKDRIAEVTGPQWQRFFAEVQQTITGKSRVLIDHLAPSYGTTEALYFAPQHPLLLTLTGRLQGTNNFTYLKLQTGDTSEFLAVVLQRSGDAMRYAPSRLAFPMRHHAAWVFAAALAIYLFLPRHRAAADEIRYSQARGAIVPDFLGVVLTGVFFLMPLAVIPANASTYEPWSLFDFQYGWAWLTLIAWGLALMCATINVTALWYATFSLYLRPDHIQRTMLLATTQWPYSQMETVGLTSWSLPRWLRWTMMVVALFNWRLMGIVLLHANQRLSGLAIRCRDGRTCNIWIDHMPQWLRVIRELRSRNIAFAPELTESLAEIEKESDEPEAPRAARPAAGVIASVLAFTLLAGGALALTYWPTRPPAIAAPLPEINPDALAAREAILKQMQQLNVRMKVAVNAVRDATPADRPAAVRNYQALQTQFEKLSAQFDSPELPVDARRP